MNNKKPIELWLVLCKTGSYFHSALSSLPFLYAISLILHLLLQYLCVKLHVYYYNANPLEFYNFQSILVSCLLHGLQS